MLFPQDPGVGKAELAPSGPFVAGQMVTLTFTLIVGREGLKPGARFRVGLPNTGWERAVPPQLRYWDELVCGKDRRLAPFHPVNTTAEVKTTSGAVVNLETMERMLLPDEDPAEAYWRWWITALVEEAALPEGDPIRSSYGNPQ